MKTLLLILFVLPLGAEDPKPTPAPTVESLTAEIESLKTQLARLQTTAAFEMRICNAAVLAAREFVVEPPPQAKKPNQLPQSREKAK